MKIISPTDSLRFRHLGFLIMIATGSISFSQSEYLNSLIYAQDFGSTYLGKVSSNSFEADSILNNFGNYGSSFSTKSIRNSFSTFGSQFGAYSAYNPFSTTPPVLYRNGIPLAYLTKNTFLFPRIDPDVLINYLQGLGSTPTPTGSILIGGTYSYVAASDSLVTFGVETISNYRALGTTSGTLVLQLWATASTYTGGTLVGYKIAEHIVGTLNGGFFLSNVGGTEPSASIPVGTYNMVFVLAEWSGTQYLTLDYGNFSERQAFGFVPTVPVFTSQPIGASLSVGDPLSLSANASSNATVSWQWFLDGNPILGATSSGYSVGSSSVSDTGSYTVVASTTAGSVTSSVATVSITSVGSAPGAPTNVTATNVGDGSATINFNAPSDTGTTAITEYVVTAVPQAGGSSIIASNSVSPITLIGLLNGTSYSITLTATNSDGTGPASSPPVVVTPQASVSLPTIFIQPLSQNLVEGGSVTLTVEATGDSLSYQWIKDGSSIIGANQNILTLTGVTTSDQATYSVRVSSSAGEVLSSNALVTVTSVVQILPPVISVQPDSQTLGVGGTTTLSVTAIGEALIYQWFKEGLPVAGATQSSMTLSQVTTSDQANYTVRVSNSAGGAMSSVASVTVTEVSFLLNLSVRTTLRASQTLVVGAVVAEGSKDLLIRAGGPALDAFGLAGLPDPEITLYNPSAETIGANDDWDNSLQSTFVEIGAFSFSSGSKDSAYQFAASGAFTVHVSGKDSEGTVLVEAYDLLNQSGARLTNVSARNFAGTGSDTFIAGFVISGTEAHRVLIRAVGPTLGNYGVSGVLENPTLTIFNSANEVVLENDNWSPELSSVFQSVGAFNFPEASLDAAIVAELPPGAYTVQVLGVDNGIGEALVEVYEITD